jgi:mannosyl-oligosaccharide alpha-1,2-mannosidase
MYYFSASVLMKMRMIFQYLAKSYVYSGKRDEQKKRMFIDCVRSTIEHMVVTPKNHTGRRFLAELDGITKKHVMGELACFVPGTFMLGARNMLELNDLEPLASDLLDSCVLAWTSTKTGIAPEVFGWADPETGEFPVPKSDRNKELEELFGLFPIRDSYILRPGKFLDPVASHGYPLLTRHTHSRYPLETLESIFYFYRYTKEEKYRDMGWELFKSIQLHCQANSGFSGVRNVDSIFPAWDDRQERLVAS